MCAFEPNVSTERSSLKARNYDGIGRVIALFVRCSPGTLVESLAGQPGAFYGRTPDVASAGRGRSRLVNLGRLTSEAPGIKLADARGLFSNAEPLPLPVQSGNAVYE